MSDEAIGVIQASVIPKLNAIYQAIGMRKTALWSTDADFQGFGILGRYISSDWFWNYSNGIYGFNDTLKFYFATASNPGTVNSSYFDVTGASTLIIKHRGDCTYSSSYTCKAEIVDGSDTVLATISTSSSGVFDGVYTIDVSALSGQVRVKITGQGYNSTYMFKYYCYYCTLDGVPFAVGGASISGNTLQPNSVETNITFLSPAFTPADLIKWEAVIHVFVQGQDTVSVDLYDASTNIVIPGYQGLDSFDSISDVSVTSLKLGINFQRGSVSDTWSALQTAGFAYLGEVA